MVQNPTVRLIYLMDADGSNPKRLTSNSPISCTEHSPHFSHDGKWITFAMACSNGNPADTDRVYRIAVDGTQQKKYSPSGSFISGANEYNPVFSSDDSAILFVGEVSSTNVDVFSITVDGSTTKRLSYCNGAKRSVRGTPMPVAGSQVVYFVSGDNVSSDDQKAKIEQVNMDGTGNKDVFSIAGLTSPSSLAGVPQDFDFALSGDGTEFVFGTYDNAAASPTSTMAIATCSIDGSNRKKIRAGGYCEQPFWR
jgi:Tol biopolymer transport system component